MANMHSRNKITSKRPHQKQESASKISLGQRRADIARFLAKAMISSVTITIPRDHPLYILDGGARAKLFKSLMKKSVRTLKHQSRPVGSEEEI